MRGSRSCYSPPQGSPKRNLQYPPSTGRKDVGTWIVALWAVVIMVLNQETSLLSSQHDWSVDDNVKIRARIPYWDSHIGSDISAGEDQGLWESKSTLIVREIDSDFPAEDIGSSFPNATAGIRPSFNFEDPRLPISLPQVKHSRTEHEMDRKGKHKATDEELQQDGYKENRFRRENLCEKSSGEDATANRGRQERTRLAPTIVSGLFSPTSEEICFLQSLPDHVPTRRPLSPFGIFDQHNNQVDRCPCIDVAKSCRAGF